MNSDAPAAGPGWFGKLACLGDFAHRRLPSEFVALCDEWLSRGVESSRSQLGEIWLDTYLTSPLWRFAWAPGVVDAQWWYGVLMPSVDNVGRYFPLVVAVTRPSAPYDGDDLHELERWFGDVSDAMLGTLQPGASLDRFEAGLGAARRVLERPSTSLAPEESNWTNRVGYRFFAGATLADAFGDLVHRDTIRRYDGRSLWWSTHASTGESQLTVADGLPRPESFVDLLQGAW